MIKINELNNNKKDNSSDLIKVSPFINTLSGLNREKIAENTKENFMNRIARDYGHSIAGDKNLGVGPITINSNTYSAIRLLSDESFKPLAFKALKAVFGDKEGFNTGTGEYYGLFIDKIKADNIDMDLVVVSDEDQDNIIEEILSCDLSDAKNLRKIFDDINDLFRMYQELTIDAAKKLIEIAVKFYNEVMVANSTVSLDHNFESFKDFKGFEISRTKKKVAPKEVALGQSVEFIDEDSGLPEKIAFRDNISVIQDAIADEFVSVISNDVLDRYNKVRVSKDVEASFALGSEFTNIAADIYEYVRKPYGKITAWKSEEMTKATNALNNKDISPYACSKRIDEVKAMYNEQMDILSNRARYYTKDLDMALAGRIMFMVSNIKRVGQIWVVDEDSTNQFFLAVAPELFTAYIAEEHAELKVCGYRALGDVKDLIEGQVLTFVNGNAQEVENVYVDSNYTGELTVQMINDVLSVVKPIEIPRIEAAMPEEITINLMEKKVINAVKFAATKEFVYTSSFKTLDDQKIFEKAEKIQLVPFYTYKDNKGKTNHVYDAVVVTIPSLSDPSIKFEIPVCQYICRSALFEKMIAGLTVAGPISEKNRRIDGKTMTLKLKYGTFEEVELNHARVENDIFEGINNDMFAPSIKVENKSFNQGIEDPFAKTEESAPSVYRIGDQPFNEGSDVEIVDDEFEELSGGNLKANSNNADFDDPDFAELGL